MAARTRKYDDDELCLDLIQGNMTQKKVAQKHGLSEVMVSQIVSGIRRPELQTKLDALAKAYNSGIKRKATRLADTAMTRLGVLIGRDSDAPHEVQRKAAMDILSHALGDPSKPEVNVNQATNNLPGLRDGDMEKLAQMRANEIREK